MAAYAALLSLKHIIEQIQHHPRPPIYLDQNQVVSLTENINFLQEFLEGYPCVGSREAIDVFESRIADAAHAAEDIIETRVVDQILGGSTAHASEDIVETRVVDQIPGGSKKIKKENTRMQDRLHKLLSTCCGAGSSRSPSMRQNVSSVDFLPDLEKVIQDMGSIKKDVREINENIGTEDHLHINNSSTLGVAGSSRSPSKNKQNTMIGFDDLLLKVMDKLTGESSNRQIFPIVGMGGIGKTTLARNAYIKPLIMHHFDIHAWVTISQNYTVPEILIEILLCISKDVSRQILSAKSEGQLGELVHKSLWGRRYLIVMDDIWSVDVCDKVNFFFPDNSNGSRIMITSRLSQVALIGSHGLVIDFLDEDKSWDLLCKNIFEKEEDCPVELEEIGKKIGRNCKGLPLSIVVIGGLLAKSEHTREHWEYISENLNSIVYLEDNERCLKVLQLSYDQLPVHLKPYFLYMGVFPEDSSIRVSWLVKLWVSEGFLKPVNGKSLEVVSREYLEDLCDRNLIRVHKKGSNGRIKFCNIHDLLRELCLREAEKEKFLYVLSTHKLKIPQGIYTERRIIIHQRDSEIVYLHHLRVHKILRYVPPVRSLICKFRLLPSYPEIVSNCRLLRVLKAVDKYSFPDYQASDSIEAVSQLVNSRFLAIGSNWQNPRFPSSFKLLWNLQTLIVKDFSCVVAPSEIWKMTQLRHVQFFNGIKLPDPPPNAQDDDCVLGNLQTLLEIRNFKCGEELVKRIPNIEKLQICYFYEFEGCISSYCLNNLGRLLKLESFGCSFQGNSPSRNDMVQNVILPNSLKKLTLKGTNLYWEDMKTKIGLLPNLQVLKLKENSFVGAEWETIEGQFCSLRSLHIHPCNLEWWTTDSTRFPRLEHLRFRGLRRLKEIPSGIGEIPMLQLIELRTCSDGAVISAKKILEEQEDFGNVGLQIRVILQDQEHLESLASPNFQIERSNHATR